LIKDTGQEALLMARIRLAKFKVEAAEKPFASGGDDYPAGSWVIAAQPGLRPILEKTAADLGLRVDGADAAPAVPRHPLDLPRLALLQTWSDTQSAGWVRMIFDEEAIPYTLIMDEDVRAGGCACASTSRPNTWTASGQNAGIRPQVLAPRPRPQYPSLGSPTSRPTSRAASAGAASGTWTSSCAPAASW
jgi:hypothetical protein